MVDSKNDVLRIGPNAKCRVYFMQNGEWVLSRNKVALPEGWVAGYLPGMGVLGSEIDVESLRSSKSVGNQ